MLRHIITTADGSNTVAVPDLNTTYHSKHGAIQESQHVFIDAGLRKVIPSSTTVSIFELGFGTGLNALLSLLEAEKLRINIYYETVEPYPVDPEIVSGLHFIERLNAGNYSEQFQMMHQVQGQLVRISENFQLFKKNQQMETVEFSSIFDLVYYDAFAPSIQPELWSVEMFRKIFDAMHSRAILLTYCSKTVVRRAMAEAGFEVNKIPGPHGKREIVRAFKP